MTANLWKPWFSIWVDPRATARDILARSRTGPFLVAVAAGMVNRLEWQMDNAALEEGSVPGMLVSLVAAGVIGAVLWLPIGSVVVEWVGRRLGGQGTREDVYRVLGWGQIPQVWSALLLVPALLAYGGDAFRLAGQDPDARYEDAVLGVAISVCNVTLVGFMLSEAQRISFLRGFASIALPLGLLIGGVMLLFMYAR